MATETQEKTRRLKTIYAANDKLTMGALDFSFNSKDGALYLRFAPQTAYHPDRQGKGEYDWKNAINVKMSAFEVGGMIRAIRTQTSFSFYHSFGETTTGGVTYREWKSTRAGKEETKAGITFSVKKGEKEVKVPVDLGTAEFVMEYFRFALGHMFSADYSREKQYFQDRQQTPAPRVEEKQPEADVPAPVDDEPPF